MDLFLESGYLDMQKLMELPYTFIFIVGARGTGKTYGSLKYAYQHHKKFIYMRRTQSQTDLINKPDFSPFKAINRDIGSSVVSKPVNKYTAAFYEGEEHDGALKASGEPLGYTAALSTISNLRGFDASDVELIIYDEFIPEYHERPIKAEGEALLNAYETINRNRELSGEPPVKLILMANSNRLDNPVFIHLGLVNAAERLQKSNKDLYTDPARSLCIISVHDSPISKLKSDTDLYKLRNNTGFSDMALENRFTLEDEKLIRYMPLKEYKPHTTAGELKILKHKSRQEYYCILARIPDPEYSSDPSDLKRFKTEQWRLFKAYMDRRVYFNDQMSRAVFLDYFA